MERREGRRVTLILTYIVEEVIATERGLSLVTYTQKHIERKPHQEKSQVFSHLDELHFDFVHGLPYARGLK